MAQPVVIPPILAAALSDQAKKEATTMTEFAAKALGDWTGTIFGTLKIKYAVGNRRVLGANSDLKRQHYAMSPIMSVIVNHCLKASGTVFVVYGGGGMGKTTALHAVMGRYARRGVAFSPGELGGSYKEIILRRLRLNADNPPNGWLEKFLDELQTPWRENPAVLMLDDFMNDRPDDLLDKALLMNIKAVIRGKNVVAFVLTTNEQSANKMIVWNSTIVPAAPDEDIRRCRAEIKKHKKSKAGTEFEIDWNKDSRLRWSTEELKNAVLVSPKYVENSKDEKDLLMGKIDVYIQNMEEEERESLNPSDILRHLLTKAGNVDILESPRDGWNSGWNCSFNF